MSFLTQVESYYRSEKIHPLRFECPYEGDCKNKNRRFTGPKVTFVGSKYEEGHCPRILFLSLDSGSGERDPKRRTARAVRNSTENDNVDNFPKHQHWALTHEMALQFLKPFRPRLTLQKVAPYFAHANAAKCCQNKPGRAAADPRLFRNCCEYIGEELGILRPDVLITQGKPAFDAVKDAISQKKVTVSRSVAWSELENGVYRTLHIKGREVLWFPTFHPRNGRFFPQKQQYWGKWSALVQRRFQ